MFKQKEVEMAGNSNLQKANKAKNDEFYTQLADIERELSHYRFFLKDKVILCNCDDPYESNFFKYFAMNFNYLGLKKLIATCYDSSPVAGEQLSIFPEKRPYAIEITEVKDENGDGAIDLADVEYLLKSKENTIRRLKSGDFRGRECIELLKQADVVVTNPPFSLFREFVAQLMKYKKKFIIIGNQNAITYKEIFPLLRDDKMWLGYGFSGNVGFFQSPYQDYAVSSQHKEGFIRVSGVMWFTNIPIEKRRERLLLYKAYSPEEYPKYDNYDAINVNKVADIPQDYDGVMGVPITFMDKYNPIQYEIVGCTESEGKGFSNGLWDESSGVAQPMVEGKRIYKRIFIKRRNMYGYFAKKHYDW